MTKITIRFSVDKNGIRRAYYWGRAKRWLPIALGAATLNLVTGKARLYETPATSAKGSTSP